MKNFYLLLIIIFIDPAFIYAQSIDKTFQDPLPIRAAKYKDLKVLPDGKILVGGDLNFYKDQKIENLIRLKPDGLIDETFNFYKEGSYFIRKVEYLENGEIIALAQEFNPLMGANEYHNDHTILHLHEDGSIINESHKLLGVSSITVQNNSDIYVFGRDGTDGYLFKLDFDFNTDSTFASFNGIVNDVQVNNGKLYVAGMFSLVNGTEHNDVVRLNLDGTIDDTFSAGSGTDDRIGSLTIQNDGKILFGNTYINNFNGSRFSGMARLNPDGSIDAGFTPSRINGPVSRIYVDDTGIYAASFVNTGDTTKNILFKLNIDDGSFDTNFSAVDIDQSGSRDFCMGFDGNNLIINNSSSKGNKYGLSKYNPTGQFVEIFQPEISRYGTITCGDYFKEKIVVAGDFIKINGIETYGIARLDNKGTVDDTFLFTDVKKVVRQIKVLNNESILVSTGKEFFKLNAQAEVQPDFNFNLFKTLRQVIKFKVLDDQKIAAGDPNNPPYRLNSDGSEDTSFDFGPGVDRRSTAFDFDVHSDNKVIFGSSFSEFNGTPANRLIRLNSDGSVDVDFDFGEGPDKTVTFIKILKGDSIIVGGFFENFNGFEVPHGLVKLSTRGVVDPVFLENQKAVVEFNWGIMNVKAEQIGNKILLKTTKSISVLNIDGTVDEDFNFPLSINNLNDIIALEKITAPEGGRITEANDYMFSLGNFIDQEDQNPSFLVKVDLQNSSEVITGIDRKEFFNPFLLYPNPAQSEISITYKGKVDHFMIAIYNATGNAVYKTQYENVTGDYPMEINLEGLNSGIYFIHFSTKKGILWSQKFIKN